MPRLRAPEKPRFLPARILVGLILAVIGGIGVVRYFAFESIAVHESGRVVDVRTESRSGGRRGGRFTISRPVVSFKLPTSSDTTTATAHVASGGGDYVKGQDVEIEFDPHDASGTLRVDTGIAVPDVATALIGVLLLGNGIYAGISSARARKAWEANEGQVAGATA
jgi:hypothetical protein